jgi:hypothetical protein
MATCRRRFRFEPAAEFDCRTFNAGRDDFDFQIIVMWALRIAGIDDELRVVAKARASRASFHRHYGLRGAMLQDYVPHRP